EVRWQDAGGRRTRMVQRRLVHMRDWHLAALEVQLTAENWSGILEVQSALDGRVENANVQRYRRLHSRHLEALEAQAAADGGLFLRVRTTQSRLEIAQAAVTRLHRDGRRLDLDGQIVREPDYAAVRFAVPVAENQTITVEKVLALYTSRDWAIAGCGLAARKAISRAGDFARLLAGHALAWKHLWDRFDLALDIDGADDNVTCVLRLHLFHLLQTACLNTLDLDAGIPARGWHGEAYRGHIFWDELFAFPLYNLRLPEITRSLLMYRYRRLDEARAMAREAGRRGAMFPWQSGSDGREESQTMHLNPRSGRWVEDPTRLEHHVGSAIAYNVWHYHEVTGDLEFLSYYGAEMLLEIARFWAGSAVWNGQRQRYDIRRVMGPDEYHERYPDAEAAGLNNNAYTNVMAAWVLDRALAVLELLPDDRRRELEELLDLQPAELDLWDHVGRRLTVPFHGDGIISQFEGYEQLKELDWDAYRQKYGDIQRLDRILKAEGDSPDRYKISKQADALMLFYLFTSEQLQELFRRQDYPFDPDAIPRTIDYYLKRTSHGSTLSRVVHSWVLARADRGTSWRLFTEALKSDLEDVQGGTTEEGIHLGAMAGTVDLVQRGYTGLAVQGDALCFSPCLPREIACLRLRIRFRGHDLALTVTHRQLTVQAGNGNVRPIRVAVKDDVRKLGGGGTLEFAL
nr:hypothetical protein [Pseudomonadota bacterium]